MTVVVARCERVKSEVGTYTYIKSLIPRLAGLYQTDLYIAPLY